MTESILNGRSAAEFCFNQCRVGIVLLHEKAAEGNFLVADSSGIAIVGSSDGVAHFYPWHNVIRVVLLKALDPQSPEGRDK